MSRLFAFLRAINVGARTVKMEDLRAHFESFGCSEVETYIASGNVIFEWKKKKLDLDEFLSRSIEKTLGFEATTFVRSTDELAKILRYQPFSEEALKEAWVVNIGFLNTSPTAAMIDTMNTAVGPVHTFAAGEREIYWLQRIPTSDVKLPKDFFEKALGSKVTFRSTKSLSKLAAKYKVLS